VSEEQKRFERMIELLGRAQTEYGYDNQISVAVEELCELGAVLSKYPRYPSHELASADIRAKVIEELADVMIVLTHVSMIFDIMEDEMYAAQDAKLVRLERWLDSGKGFHQTTVDREVKPVEPQGV
jgi:NTP pyrophosphatase (non-canonical NTP hydrolase)